MHIEKKILGKIAKARRANMYCDKRGGTNVEERPMKTIKEMQRVEYISKCYKCTH